MKSIVKQLLQKSLGMRTYLFLFSNFIIYTLPFNKRENDFLYFIKLIKGDGLILDIGANIGIMTYHLSRKKPNSTILAFEPVPINIHTLQKIVLAKKLTNVKVFPFALGAEDTKGEIVLPEVGQVLMQGLSHIVHDSITEFNEGKTFKIEIRKIDNLTEIVKHPEKVIAIKMDVENYESFVLEGAKEIIKAHKPIIYTELWENQNRTNCIKILSEIGYQPYLLENNRLILFNNLVHKTQNFFFLPD